MMHYYELERLKVVETSPSTNEVIYIDRASTYYNKVPENVWLLAKPSVKPVIDKFHTVLIEHRKDEQGSEEIMRAQVLNCLSRVSQLPKIYRDEHKYYSFKAHRILLKLPLQEADVEMVFQVLSHVFSHWDGSYDNCLEHKREMQWFKQKFPNDFTKHDELYKVYLSRFDGPGEIEPELLL